MIIKWDIKYRIIVQNVYRYCNKSLIPNLVDNNILFTGKYLFMCCVWGNWLTFCQCYYCHIHVISDCNMYVIKSLLSMTAYVIICWLQFCLNWTTNLGNNDNDNNINDVHLIECRLLTKFACICIFVSEMVQFSLS